MPPGAVSRPTESDWCLNEMVRSRRTVKLRSPLANNGKRSQQMTEIILAYESKGRSAKSQHGNARTEPTQQLMWNQLDSARNKTVQKSTI
jgi:hypothetical protein